MADLTQQHCEACEGGVAPMTKEKITAALRSFEGWSVNENNTILSKRFAFKGFYRTMAFVNAIAWIANRENHHPDMEVGYNYCNVRYSTHAINGLSMNDFICAAKVDALID